MVQDGKSAAVGVDREQRATAVRAAAIGSSIQSASRQQQAGRWISTVIIGEREIRGICGKAVKIVRSQTIGADGENRSVVQFASKSRGPVQRAAGQNQSAVQVAAFGCDRGKRVEI